LRTAFAGALAVALLGAGPAAASVPHTVRPGETLWSIAAANNLHTNALAAHNGVSPEAKVVLGGTINVPTEAEAAAAVNAAAPAVQATPQQAADGGTRSEAPPALGSYKVRQGETLSGIAARAGIAPEQVAAANGLDPDGPLLVGTVLKLPPAGADNTQQTAPAPAPDTERVPDVAPYATPGHTNADEIGQIASAHGVDPSLATAVAWQESGFNNGLVSRANARGVMQILPGTWSWVQDNLASASLDPHAPQDNVHAGVLYLRQLLNDTGGDERTAIASYYQGLGSVRDRGLMRETERYVDAVMAHRGRFGR
jgi:soluble lytic murein transglycosylase-like protein